VRIDHCPKCKKAGLKYASNWDIPQPYHFEKDADGNSHVVRDYVLNYPPGGYGTAKWCPRCQEWVKPENHEYIGR
jgi:hypothetical protein